MVAVHVAALLLLLSAHGAASSNKLDIQRDIVIAVPSCAAYINFVHATRPFRKGIRAFITVEKASVAEEQNKLSAQQPRPVAYPETYAHHPDNPPVRHKKNWRLHEGRWLLTSFLAHQHYRGRYKWMLLGDDDTLWLLTGVRHLLAPYDPSLPYWISDAVAELQQVVGEKSPRITVGQAATGTLCLPCHTPDSAIQALSSSFPEGSAARVLEWKGCPCTAQQGCAHRYARCQLRELRDRFAPSFVGNGTHCTAATSAYGGAGMVLSAAMMDALPAEEVRKSAHQQYSWGDYRLAQIIHEAGFGLTYPEASVVVTGALDHRRYRLFGHDQLPGLLTHNDGLASCMRLHGKQCNWTLSHAVSCHLRHKGDKSALPQQLKSMASVLKHALRSMGHVHEHLFLQDSV